MKKINQLLYGLNLPIVTIRCYLEELKDKQPTKLELFKICEAIEDQLRLIEESRVKDSQSEKI